MVGKIIFLVVIPIIAVFLLMSSPTTPWNEEDIEYTAPPEYNPPPPDYGNIPEPYYVLVPQQYGVDALREFLQNKDWDRDFEEDVFDCTEMSALLERKLENEGFHTYIVVGQCNNSGHAWVKVEAVPEIYVIVESTTLTVIVPGDARYNKYRETHQHEAIYDALKISQSAWDWWN